MWLFRAKVIKGAGEGEWTPRPKKSAHNKFRQAPVMYECDIIFLPDFCVIKKLKGKPGGKREAE